MSYRILLPALLAAGFLAAPAMAQQTGLTAETWTGLTPGKSILILRKEGISVRTPNTTQTVAEAKITGLATNCGTRLRGTLTPPVDDTYTFWVNGTDNVALWLSEDGTRFTKRLIAWHLGSTTTTEWSKHANQKSIPIALTAGTTYHIEAHVMSSANNGHLSIAWQGRDGNWALAGNGATATQSTTQWGMGADRAIDGKTVGTWGDATMTTNQQNSWFKVDFAQVRPVNEVVLFNSPSNQNRLSNFRISALDASGTELVGENLFTTSGNVGNSFTWTLPNTVEAKSVKIQLLGNNRAGNGHLSLAEVQAYGPGPLALTRNFQVIPGTYLTPITTDPDDTNDNNLSDIWEQQTGLATSTLPGALLEFGDPDQDSISNYEEQVLGSDPLVAEAFGDVITRSMWMDLSGNGSEGVVSMTNFANRSRYLSYPNDVSLVAGIDANLSYKNYGARYRGSFVAPTTGSYRFWLAASGDAQLWLSDGTVKDPTTNQPLTNRFGKQLLATSGHVTPQRDFDYRAHQRSRSVTLVEGQTYYIETLHKVAQGSLDHVSVAWKPPGESRSIMPATVFRVHAPDPADADDDGLPDSWETSVGLNPANNGLTSAADGEYGDPDGDGLTNLQEHQYGTNPFSADTDGDGVSDYDEIFLYGSDPLVSNNLAPVTITLPPLNQYTGATGTWTSTGSGSLSLSALDRRGAITYSFTLTEPGVHEVVLAAGAISSNPWITKSLPIELSLDGSPIARKTLLSKNSNADTLRAITPWLSAGTHTVTVLHENYSSLIRLRIDSLTLKRLGGADLDENNIPDWIEEKEALANTLTRVPATSLTSPVSIEGTTRQLSSTSLSALAPIATEADDIEVTASINETFFADVPLSTDGAVALDASFLGGIVTETHSIAWTPTNLLDTFTDDTLHIRLGDSLRVTAHDPNESASGSFTLSGTPSGLPTGSLDSATPYTLTFDTAGTYSLSTVWTPESGPTESATITIVVHSANFGASHLVQVNTPRNWTPPTLGTTALVEADDRVVFSEITTTGARQFKVSASQSINRHVLARLPGDIDGAPSAILARGTIHAFEVINVSQTQDASIVTQYPDGTWLLHNTIVAVNLPANIIVRITAQNQGTLFTNGSTTLDLNSTHFDANGIAHAYYEWAGTGSPTICHRVQLFLAP
jgi:hypothetical protein